MNGDRVVTHSSPVVHGARSVLDENHIGAIEGGDEELSVREYVRKLLLHIGEDPDREGLAKTPERVELAIERLCRGYRTSVDEVVNGAVFEEAHDSMILVRDIEVYSLCEHHLMPFFGKAHVAYIPKGKIIGLSKIPRVVDVFAQRLQIQERLTDEIADALMRVVEPLGVGVVMEAFHLCMMMRGVEKQHSKTVTSSLRGCFLAQKTRDEFLRLVHGGSLLD